MNLTIGETLKIERLRRRISQQRLASRLGVDQSVISRIETGNIAADDSMVERIMSAIEAESATCQAAAK